MADDYEMIRQRLDELHLDPFAAASRNRDKPKVVPVAPLSTAKGWCNYCDKNGCVCDGSCEDGGCG